jgi:hypothetical protein
MSMASMACVSRMSTVSDPNTPEQPKQRGRWVKGQGSPNPGGRKKSAAPPQAPQPSPQAGAKPQPHAEVEQPATTSKIERVNGKFAPGNREGKGRPVGSRHKASLIAEQLFDDKCELLVAKCVEMALAGDPTAMRIAISRLVPERKSRPVSLPMMPKIEHASDLIKATGAIMDASAAGEITVDEAAALSQLVANVAKSVETFELSDRLAKLEEQIAAKGGN